MSAKMAPNKKRFYTKRIRRLEHLIQQQELFAAKVKEVGTLTERVDADVDLAKLRIELGEVSEILGVAIKRIPDQIQVDVLRKGLRALKANLRSEHSQYENELNTLLEYIEDWKGR